MDPLEQERSEDTEDVPSSLVMGQLRALPQRSSVGGRMGKDPRFGRVFTPDDSKRLNHTATQVRKRGGALGVGGSSRPSVCLAVQAC
jgi:hypothetical protein